MLSVLIPTYNYDITTLVQEVHAQLLVAKIPFEIICLDDCSTDVDSIEKNNVINSLSNASYVVLEKNIGRSNIRNLLSDKAQYKFILFIDGDSLIVDNLYIQRYLDAITENSAIIYGGRVHPKKVSSERLLRWKYGVYREDTTAKNRKKNPYKSILCNNTLMTKTTFEAVGFDKNITQYGHEDTIFAFKISKLKSNIQHIENPVLHGDVDLNEVFFHKTHQSLKNLNYIYKQQLIDVSFITFLNTYTILKKYKLNYILSVIHKIGYRFFKWQLTSKKPSLHIFNLFRLSYFCTINLRA